MEFRIIVLYCFSFIAFTVSTDPCTTHIELTNEIKRATTYKMDFEKDIPINDMFLNDGWYRIVSTTGDEMPTYAPGPMQCGTLYPIWLNGKLPNTADGIVKKEVCIQFFMYHCAHAWNIDIKNCNDEYYVYNLISSPVEKSAYCFGTNKIPCPDGQSSETGFYPGCKPNYPNATVTLTVEPDLVAGPVVVPFFGNSLVTVFRCKFDEAIGNSGETYIYDVIWYINENLVKQHNNISYSDIESTNLVEEDWVGTHKLNMVVKCAVRLRFSEGSTPGPEESSPIYSAGIYPERYEYQVREDETINVTLHSTFPLGCIGHTNQHRMGCTYRLRLVQPRYQKQHGKCNNNIDDNDLVFDRQNCYYEVVSATWNDPISIKITGYVNGQYDHSYRTTYLKVQGQVPVGTPSPWDGIEIPEIKIVVTDREYQTARRLCKSVNDPHMTTMDGRYYEFHNPGEFILYRHRNLPYQVNALYGKCNNNRATCNCGIAIRSGKSLFVMRNCDEITTYNTHTHNPLIEMKSCDDSSMTVQEFGKTYTVTLPIGTEIKFSTSEGWGIWNNFIGYIHIKPSIIDLGNVEGLCGDATVGWADTSDDFRLRDGSLVGNAYTFGENWRVTNDEKFFVNFPVILSENINLQQYCVCDDETDSGTSDDEFNFRCGLSGPLQSCLAQTANSAIFHTTCSTGKRKRSLTDSDDIIDDRALLIANDDDLKSTNPPESKTDWPTGWTEELARTECESTLKSSITEEVLEASNLNIEEYIQICMLDIQEVGDLRFIQDTIGSMQASAMTEISRNETLFLNSNVSTTNTVGDKLLDSLCPKNCSQNGLCRKGVCECNPGFGNQDCSEDLKVPPQNISIPLGGICNSRERSCAKTNVQGVFNSREITCRSRHFQVENDGSWTYTSTAQKYPAQYKNSYLVTCELPSLHRKKRSTPGTIIADGYDISLSNDGSNFGDDIKIMIYDEDCFSCDISQVTCVSLDTCPTTGATIDTSSFESITTEEITSPKTSDTTSTTVTPTTTTSDTTSTTVLPTTTTPDTTSTTVKTTTTTSDTTSATVTTTTTTSDTTSTTVTPTTTTPDTTPTTETTTTTTPDTTSSSAIILKITTSIATSEPTSLDTTTVPTSTPTSTTTLTTVPKTTSQTTPEEYSSTPTSTTTQSPVSAEVSKIASTIPATKTSTVNSTSASTSATKSTTISTVTSTTIASTSTASTIIPTTDLTDSSSGTVNGSSTNQATMIGVIVGVITVLLLMAGSLILYKMKTANKRRWQKIVTRQNLSIGNSPKYSGSFSSLNREKTNASIGSVSMNFGDDTRSRPRTPVELFCTGRNGQK